MCVFGIRGIDQCVVWITSESIKLFKTLLYDFKLYGQPSQNKALLCKSQNFDFLLTQAFFFQSALNLKEIAGSVDEYIYLEMVVCCLISQKS